MSKLNRRFLTIADRFDSCQTAVRVACNRRRMKNASARTEDGAKNAIITGVK